MLLVLLDVLFENGRRESEKADAPHPRLLRLLLPSLALSLALPIRILALPPRRRHLHEPAVLVHKVPQAGHGELAERVRLARRRHLERVQRLARRACARTRTRTRTHTRTRARTRTRRGRTNAQPRPDRARNLAHARKRVALRRHDDEARLCRAARAAEERDVGVEEPARVEAREADREPRLGVGRRERACSGCGARGGARGRWAGRGLVAVGVGVGVGGWWRRRRRRGRRCRSGARRVDGRQDEVQVGRVDRMLLRAQERDEPPAAQEDDVQEVELSHGVLARVERARELVAEGGREAVHLD